MIDYKMYKSKLKTKIVKSSMKCHQSQTFEKEVVAL